jgi:hypothetical protein
MKQSNDPDLRATKPKLTISTPFTEVFYKNQWMAMPMAFLPPDDKAPDENTKKADVGDPVYSYLSPTASIVPYLLGYRELLRLCRQQDVPFFWVTGLLPPRSPKNEVFGSSDRKSAQVTGKVFREFIKFLPSKIRLMAELYWYINKQIKQIGLIYGWEELCFMREEAMPEQEDFFPTVVNFSRTGRFGARGERFIAHAVPNHLIRRMRKGISPTSRLIFSQKNGGPFTRERLAKEFSKASKEAKKAGVISQNVSLRDLRDSVSMTNEMLEKMSKKTREKKIPEISDEQLQEIQRLIPQSLRNSGAKPSFSLRSVVQAITYREQFACSWSKLPDIFPREAAKSQHARWKKKGILKKVLQVAIPTQP